MPFTQRNTRKLSGSSVKNAVDIEGLKVLLSGVEVNSGTVVYFESLINKITRVGSAVQDLTLILIAVKLGQKFWRRKLINDSYWNTLMVSSISSNTFCKIIFSECSC